MRTIEIEYFLDSKITADGDGSHEIKRRLLLGRKAMRNLNSILKSRDITLLTNIHIVKAMFCFVFFPVVMDVKVSEEEWMLSNCGATEDF